MFKQLNFENGQQIASIGCGGGLWEIAWSFEFENLEITLQDINEAQLNFGEVQNTIQYFEQKFQNRNKNQFEIVIGTNENLNLLPNKYDKILLINSLHEFQYQQLILQQIRQVLKPNGQLIIEEQLASYENQLHDGCGKALFSIHSLHLLLAQNEFHLVKCHIDENKTISSFKVSTNLS
jgi:ubiquinone/menaquinone biosynthesis C-methylase UbiE